MREMLRREEGMGLAEVVVSAVVLMIVVLGTYAAIDGPSSLSGANKARTVAAALAEQDQERLRAFKATDLSNHYEQRFVTVSGVRYTVESRALWTSDASGTESCHSSSKRADYLQISSTVTWPAMTGKPVQTVSVVAPPSGGLGPNRGNLVVQLASQGGSAVDGVPITTSPATSNVTTNRLGCAFFGHVPAGGYQVRFGVAGWVNPAGASSVVLNGSVTAGTTTTLSELYARAASIDVGFDTQVGSAEPVSAQAQSVTVASPGLPAPGTRLFRPAGLASAVRATNLFPFTSGYGVYAGSCPSADPTAHVADYWSRYPGFVSVTPGAGAQVTVRVPALRVRVMRGGSPVNGAHVIARATGAGCTEAWTLTTGSGGFLTAPGLPFGNYSVCADDGNRRVTLPNVANTNPAGSAVTNMTVPSSGGRSVCV